MKILAIRGKNLTSLSGDFVLELDQPPLDKLGLFAITGATGAGKSTLLDALCLALFDRTPRLGGRGGVPVGRPGEEDEDRLLSHDVRSVLRRGSAEGHAEVDFLGKDGRRYRARWAVWRARNKAEGRFRPQELSLTDVASGQSFGRTKSEVLEAIEQRLGLSFDQFRRSALLAQNEFAAFLRADASERAELLERMTGTEVYSRLSIAAHERNKAEQLRLEKMEAGLQAISRLPDEERAKVAQALGDEEAARTKAEGVLAQAMAAAEWYSARARLVQSEQEATAAQAQAAQAVEAAAPREARLARVRAAEAFRAPVAAVESAERGLAEATAAQAGRVAEAAKAREASGAREAELAQADTARAAARTAEEAAAPELVEADRLDAQLVAERREAHEASQRAQASREAEAQAAAVLAGIAEQELTARKAAETVQAWLTEYARLGPLAREWSRWEAELQRYERAASSEQQAREELARLGLEVEKLREAAEGKRQERQSAAEATELAQATSTQAEASTGADASAARRTLRDALLARQEALRALSGAREAAAAEALAEQEARKEAQAAEQEASSAAAEAREAAVRKLELEARLKEAQRSQAQAQAAQSLGSHRAALRDGEPCPLCGATEHPYSQAEAALEGLVVEAASRVEALASERTATERREASASTREQAARPRQAQAEKRRSASAEKRAVHQHEWSQARSRLDHPLTPEHAEDSGAQAWLEQTLKQVQAQLSEVRAEEEAAEARTRAAREARAALEACRSRLEQALEAQRGADEALSEAERRSREAEREAEQAGAARRQALVDVAPAFAAGSKDWEARLAAQPEAFRKKCKDGVGAWNAREQELKAAQERESEARSLRTAAEVRSEAQRDTALEHASASQRAEQAVQTTQAARAKVLQGRPTEQVRAALRATVEAATQAYEKARAATEAASRDGAIAATRAEDAAKACTLATQAREQAHTTLAALLRGQGVTLEEVRALLAYDAAWCEGEDRALAAVRDSHTNARAVLEERRTRRAQHEASASPSLPEPEVAATCERARADVEARRTAAARTKARLDQDDEARSRYGAEAQALEEGRRAAEVWKTLHELIGSSDGKKFKVFAQSLTLDALLLHANTHLEELARRYRLMRVPGYDLDLQVVDQDMGDEMRGLASLSGGESFLVSLALALGLASLSSETTQVETLFIDEGFGTLDPETLEVALATLDALQATGRQVGIISHVSGLAERIGVQVRVVKQGAGRSRLVVHSEASGRRVA